MLESQFAYGRNLVGHGLRLSSCHAHKCLCRIDSLDFRTQGHHDQPIENAIGRIVAQHHRGPRFLDLTTNGRIERNPKYITPPGKGLQLKPPSIAPLLPREHGQQPSRDIRWSDRDALVAVVVWQPAGFRPTILPEQ